MVLTGCAHVPERVASSSAQVDKSAGGVIDLSDLESVRSSLYAQYDEWKGTPYQLGGMSKNSVDCSGFIYITFKSKLGLILPRSTDLQVGLGISVDKDELRPGDLVFFKTGKALRHVGVYIEESKFLHASTKQGVIISDLNNSYWKSAYWTAKRLEM
ncbi:MAG: C40 family peptidase [Nitrosospira sp.]|nr:C40 family peptidase [Nitrosospira sp.]